MVYRHTEGSAQEILARTGMHPLLYAHHLWLASTDLNITPGLWLENCPSGDVQAVLAYLLTAASFFEMEQQATTAAALATAVTEASAVTLTLTMTRQW